MSKNNSEVSLCPHCQNRINVNDNYCKTCGYLLSNNQEDNKQLRFGKNNATTAVLVNEKSINKYSQNFTKNSQLIKTIFSFVFLFVGIFSLLMMFLPLFSKDNVWNFLSNITSSADEANTTLYAYQFDEILKITPNSNFIVLFKNIQNYSTSNHRIINPTYILFLYHVIVCFCTILLSGFGIALIVLAIISIIKKQHSMYLKKILKILTSISTIMICVLNCYGWPLIFLTFFGIISLVLLYLTEIICHEKAFMKKQLLHKSICCSALVFLILISSFSLIRLNVVNGACLYNFKTSNEISQNYISCKGIYLEFMQFLQCSSGDNKFTNFTFLISEISLVAHLLFVCFAITACVNLIESLSNQGAKFPISKIMISFGSFVVFAVSIILFNQIINNAGFNNYMSAVGNSIANYLQTSDLNQIKDANKIFTFRFGLIIAMIFYLPVSVYAIIAKKICLKKTFY